MTANMGQFQESTGQFQESIGQFQESSTLDSLIMVESDRAF
jgi:hypothetical protein